MHWAQQLLCIFSGGGACVNAKNFHVNVANFPYFTMRSCPKTAQSGSLFYVLAALDPYHIQYI